MPRISVSKERLEGPPLIPDGEYEIRLEEFKPTLTKNKDSYNLNPRMKIVNHHELNGRDIFDGLNTKADWVIEAFCHCFGQQLIDKGNGEADIPGEFDGPQQDPTKWTYRGPLTGSIGKVFLRQVDNTKGRMVSKVDQYVCALGGACSRKHPTKLAG